MLPKSQLEALAADPKLKGWWLCSCRVVRVLGQLSRRPVPRDLEGRVVAATQSGHRQERVIQRLLASAQRRAPKELDVAVRRDLERPFQRHADGPLPARTLPAPEELDRRVAREIGKVSSAEGHSSSERRLAGNRAVGMRPVVGGRSGPGKRGSHRGKLFADRFGRSGWQATGNSAWILAAFLFLSGIWAIRVFHIGSTGVETPSASAASGMTAVAALDGTGRPAEITRFELLKARPGSAEEAVLRQMLDPFVGGLVQGGVR